MEFALLINYCYACGMNKDFISRLALLNEDQLKAVNEINGPVMVVAWPGTWKTEIIGMRVANILQLTDIGPDNILVITFTESWARAIKDRLLSIIWLTSYKINVCTFHGLCNEVIMNNPEKFALTDVLDDIEAIEIIKDILDNGDFKLLSSFKMPYYYVDAIIRSISSVKREGVSPNDLLEIILKMQSDFDSNVTYNKKTWKRLVKWDDEEKKINKLKELQLVYVKYEECLLNRGKYDFNDMILSVLKVLSSDDGILAYYQEKYQYILVDEYQDTNWSQNEIIRLIASFDESPNMFVVWDDDQSIYRFQGAELENMLELERNYGSLTKIVLTKNYRSHQGILDAAMSLIENNKQRLCAIDESITKKLSSCTLHSTCKVDLVNLKTSHDEKIFILEEIKAILAKWISPREIAIFTRTNREVEDVAEFLLKNSIQVCYSGGENILADRLIQIVLDYFRTLEDPFNDETMYFVLSLPINWISQVDIAKISRYLNTINFDKKYRKSIFDVMLDEELQLNTRDKIVDFVDRISRFRVCLIENVFYKAFEEIVRESGLLDYVYSKGGIVSLNKLNTLLDKIYVLNKKDQNLSLSKFLGILWIYQEFGVKISWSIMESDSIWVNVMTAHKSKWLEFNYSFVYSCIDWKWWNRKVVERISLPSLANSTPSGSIDKNEEERRLFYVCMTRAKQRLYLTYPKIILDEMSQREVNLSQFVNEIDQNLLQITEPEITKELYEKYFMTKFNPVTKDLDAEEREYLKPIVDQFKLSFTSYYTYKDCPLHFKNKFLLKMPEPKNKHIVLWNILHRTFERFNLEYQAKGIKPSVNELLKAFDYFVDKELFSPKEKTEILELWRSGLVWYFEKYPDYWKPLGIEYNFYSKNIVLDNAYLTWSLDKFEAIWEAEWGIIPVRVIDYKTGSVKSEDRLTCDDSREKSQIVFYKVLTELDKEFSSKYCMMEWMIDYVLWKYKQVIIPFSLTDVEAMKADIIKVYNDICLLKFEWCWKPGCKSCW